MKSKVTILMTVAATAPLLVMIAAACGGAEED